MNTDKTVRVTDGKKTWTFDGVVSIQHEMTLKVQNDADPEKTEGLVNHALNEPDRLVLNVVQSDAQPIRNAGSGRAANLLRDLTTLKRNRALLKVVTPLRVCTDMLLTELIVTRESGSQSGWTGRLTFRQAAAINKTVRKDNASTTTGSGKRSPLSSDEPPDLSGLDVL